MGFQTGRIIDGPAEQIDNSAHSGEVGQIAVDCGFLAKDVGRIWKIGNHCLIEKAFWIADSTNRTSTGKREGFLPGEAWPV